MFAAAALPLALSVVAAVPAPPGAAFVVDSSAVVRTAPKDAAAVVVEVPIWTAVRVDAVDGAWARVTVGPRTLVYDSPAAEAKPVAPRAFDGRWPHGFMRVAALDAAPEGRLGLVARAKAAGGEERALLLLRAFTLDPHDNAVARLAAGPGARPSRTRVAHAAFAAADLVDGCRGDLARAVVVVHPPGERAGRRDPTDACLAHVDLRAPCDTASAAAHKHAVAALEPRFASFGPALRLVPALGAVDHGLYVVTHLVAQEGCSADCQALAGTTDVRVDRLHVPRIADGRTVLYVVVPRYTGALYDVVAADDRDDVEAGPLHFEVPGSFDADPRDDPGPGVHLFTAPRACCSCDEAY